MNTQINLLSDDGRLIGFDWPISLARSEDAPDVRQHRRATVLRDKPQRFHRRLPSWCGVIGAFYRFVM
jgi:hypothetical protein